MTWDKRGRHRGHHSRETHAWLALSADREWLRPGTRVEPSQAVTSAPPRPNPGTPPPPRPDWMAEAVYADLLALRGELDEQRRALSA
jgi:hypothetical protein